MDWDHLSAAEIERRVENLERSLARAFYSCDRMLLAAKREGFLRMLAVQRAREGSAAAMCAAQKQTTDVVPNAARPGARADGGLDVREAQGSRGPARRGREAGRARGRASIC